MNKSIHYSFLSFLFWILLFFPRISVAQQSKDSSSLYVTARIYSIYMYNFTKYVEWPQEVMPKNGNSFKIGVLASNKQLFTQIEKVANTKNVAGAPIEIVHLQNFNSIDGLQMIFSDLSNNINTREIISKINNRPILLVTENNPDFDNSMINFLTIDNKTKFSLNKVTMEKCSLRVSPSLAEMAVKEGAITSAKEWSDVFSKYKKLMQLPGDKIDVSKDDLTQILKAHDNQNAQISEQANLLDKQKLQISSQQDKLSEQMKAIQEKEDQINHQEAKIFEQEERFKAIEQETRHQVVEFNENKKKLLELADLSSKKDLEIADKEKILQNNLEEIKAQTNQIKEQQFVLKTQKSILYVSIGVILLISILAFISYKNFRQKKKANIELVQQKKEVELQKELVEEKNKEITDSITYAKRIQKALLANDKLLDNHLKEYFVLYMPKDIVSGDFYWASAKNKKLYISTADCTGHGVPGAFMSLLNISYLNEAVNTIEAPNQIMGFVRSQIIDALKTDGSEDGGKDGMDCVLACFDFEKGLLSFASANNPVWIIRDRELTETKPDKFPVGKHDKDDQPFTLHEHKLLKGDSIYFLTDGYADQFGGPKGKKFKYQQLKDLLIASSGSSMADQKTILKSSIENWRGNLEQVDDILIIGIKI
jgi:serine phosphatase RsbU (regulator of sigma subunit)